ncbi:MAG: PAS domain-containing protein [Nitrospinota bacterium]|nr:MAG: PAS domain-containing protein [Nitrospinota bacterium]
MTKDLYEATLHHLPQGILLLSGEGKILYSNLSLAHTLGYDDPSALLRLSPDAFQTEDSPLRDSQILTACQAGKTWQGEVVYRTKEGETRRFHVRLIPLAEIADVPLLAFHAEAGSPLADAQERLDEVIKRVRRISHDLNNPLTTLLGNVELALMRLPESDPLYKRLQTILKQAERMRELVARLHEIKYLAQP